MRLCKIRLERDCLLEAVRSVVEPALSVESVPLMVKVSCLLRQGRLMAVLGYVEVRGNVLPLIFHAVL
jgi:hypothetical protein